VIILPLAKYNKEFDTMKYERIEEGVVSRFSACLAGLKQLKKLNKTVCSTSE
jgi:hypothetical protein